jgi:hypothetical protein
VSGVCKSAKTEKVLTIEVGCVGSDTAEELNVIGAGGSDGKTNVTGSNGSFPIVSS